MNEIFMIIWRSLSTGFRYVRERRGKSDTDIHSHADPPSQREVSNIAICLVRWLGLHLPQHIVMDLWTSQSLATVI